ncbi:SprT-like family protein [Caulifigura coniformis]|uniref:SprT-like family protein n=1 Tax=Caulifigura coniformis TaxID=2527983 RepID=A0A517SCM0_9PLAN|nr:hypothetical protein [Caulifigura coniformis]QDT53863.1 SprT-like family protein [Caulifigura coniformis]
MEPLDSALAALARHLKKEFDERLSLTDFGPKHWVVPLPRILVMEPKRSTQTLGWYAPKRWGQGAVKLDELVLTPRAVSHGVLPAASVLAHELVHVANAIAKRADTSRQGRYHNELFRQTAECVGLTFKGDRSAGFGWYNTSLGKELEAGIKELIRTKAVDVYPLRFQRRTKTKAKRSLVKLEASCNCGDGGEFVYATAVRAPVIQLCCGVCGRRYRVAD